MTVSANIVADRLYPIEFESFIFSGGEPHVKITNPEDYRQAPVLIDVRFTSGKSPMEELMTAFVLTDAIKHLRGRCRLLLPYVPGARQDRIASGSGTGLTIKVVANMINAMKYDAVYVLDPHSDVTTALIENSFIIDTWQYLSQYIEKIGKVDGVIAPDAGASKRYERIFKFINVPVITAGKTRDFATGTLSGFTLPSLPSRGSYLIVDDICDGGGTFIGLEEQFRNDPNGKTSFLHLWTTHGIYSKGIGTMLEVFNSVGCTDSFIHTESDANFKQIGISRDTLGVLL